MGVWAACGINTVWYGVTAGSVGERLLMMAIGLAVLALSALSLRRGATFDHRGGVDVAGLRRMTFGWEQVADLYVGRPPGLLYGYCIVLSRKNGSERALLGTRVYSRLPSAKHHQELMSLAEKLRDSYLAVGDAAR
jgi:hypothetical protein